MRKKPSERSAALYTGLFLLCAFAMAGVFALRGKLPIQTMDGYWQHYTVLGYISKAVRGLLSGKGIAMNSPYLGQGMDVLTTLSYYGLTDPLNLLSALFTEDQIWIAYIAIAALRIYLCGLAFLLLARELGCKNGWANAAGALMYVFCGFSLFNLARHTYFINGMLYLPLILAGVECALRNGKWLGYTLTVVAMLLSSVYFAWINTLIAIVYILLRLIARGKERGLRGTAADGWLLLAGYLLGALITTVVLLPVAIAYLNNARLGGQMDAADSLWRYDLQYYLRALYTAFLADGKAAHWTILNLCPLALFGLICLCFARGRGAHVARCGVLLCAIGLCVPVIGKIMNLGGYAINRWCYALSLFICLGATVALPFMTVRKRALTRWSVSLPVLAWACACGIAMFIYHRFWFLLILECVLAVTLAVVYGTGGLNNLSRKGAQRAMAVFMLLMILCQEGVYYDTTNQYEELFGYDINENYANETPAVSLAGKASGRIEHQLLRDPHALLKEYRGTGYYWSLVPSSIAGYYRDLGLPSQAALAMLSDLGGSAELNAVASVQYYIPSQSLSEAVVPWGFAFAESAATPDGTRYDIYENQYALPLGYAYDAALSTSAWASMSVEQRLQAVSSRAVCDSSFVPVEEAPDNAVQLAWSVEKQSGITGDGQKLFAEEGAELTLRFAATEDSEVWLIAEGMTVSATDVWIGAETEATQNLARLSGPDNNFAYERPQIALCLGSSDAVGDTCLLRFYTQTECSWDDFRVVSLPMSDFRGNIEDRQKESLTDIVMGNDSIKGSITVSGDRILQLSVPYSSGWTARIDGQPATLFACGGMYMGLELHEGAHTIELSYVTPGLRAGAVLSALGLILTAAFGVLRRRRGKAGKGVAERGAEAHQEKTAENRKE